MRRYSLAEGPRYLILAELEDHISGARHHGRPGKDQVYLDALAAMEGGAAEAAAGDFVFRVAAESHPAPMLRTDVAEGTLEELVDELERLRADRERQARADRVKQYADAIAELRGGAPSTRVRQTLYQVTPVPV